MQFISNHLQQFQQSLIVIIGATCSGKTSYSIKIAQEFNGEIISADSRQIYRGMDIGTAKITREERQGIPHYLLDIVNPDQEFSVAKFKRRAFEIIDDILERGKVPILVGGTGLYIDAVIYNFVIPQKIIDQKLRSELERRWDRGESEKIFAELQELDPIATEKIDQRNKHHLLRALEVVLCTGQSKFSHARKKDPKYNYLQIGIEWSRDELYERINKRVEMMWEKGLVNETQQLLEQGYSADLPSMTSIGYREAIAYLNGAMTKEESITQIQQKSRHYAKRQITWWRGREDILSLKG